MESRRCLISSRRLSWRRTRHQRFQHAASSRFHHGWMSVWLLHSAAVHVRRAPIGPGLWPGPRRQARWAGRGLRGQRRAAGASRAAGCGAPLRLEGPARTMRGVPPRRCDIFTALGASGAWSSAWPWCWRARQRDTAGTAGGRSPGCRARQPPRRRARVRRTRRKLPPRNGETPGEPWPPTAGHPGRLRRVTLAAHPSAARARPRCSRPGPLGPARRRCALDDREENPHSIDMAAVGSSRRGPGYGYSGQSNRAQMVRLVWSPSIPHSSATARTMSRPWCRVGSIIPWFQGPPLSWTSIRA